MGVLIPAPPSLYALLLPVPQPKLELSISEKFSGEFLKISDTQLLIVASGKTAIDISNELGISDSSAGTAIVFAVSSYYGRADVSVWDWIATKLGTRQNA